MADHSTAPETSGPEDLRVFLTLCIPIIVITVALAAFIVSVQPLRGQ